MNIFKNLRVKVSVTSKTKLLLGTRKYEETLDFQNIIPITVLKKLDRILVISEIWIYDIAR